MTLIAPTQEKIAHEDPAQGGNRTAAKARRTGQGRPDPRRWEPATARRSARITISAIPTPLSPKPPWRNTPPSAATGKAYDRQIAKTADPQERQALDLRKRIEGAEYLALTGDRIAQQSEIITGRREQPGGRQGTHSERPTGASRPRICASSFANCNGRRLRRKTASASALRAEPQPGDPATAREAPAPNQYAPTNSSRSWTRAKAKERTQTEKDSGAPKAAGARARTPAETRPGTIARSGVAGQPGRTKPSPRRYQALRQMTGAGAPFRVPAGWLALDGLQPAVEIENALALDRPRNHGAEIPPLQAAA